MRGRVTSDGREAMLPLTVIGSSGILAEVEATVDTGSLCLPPDVVRYLSVPFIGRGVAVLADGSTVETSYHRNSRHSI
jgi:predicted aspartyl protease